MLYLRLRDLTDEDLVWELRRGDGDALAVLFERHRRQVFGVAHRVLRDSGEAEDLLQEMYLQIYRDAAQFDVSRGSVKNWLLHNTYRRSLNRLKYLRVRGHYQEASSGRPRPCSRGRGLADYQSFIRCGLDRLTKNERYVIEQVCFGGLALKEVAVGCGASLVSTRNYYYRAIRKLRAILGADQHGRS
jgi:RNA polymerase sigma-70 factor, ECF subfamily